MSLAVTLIVGLSGTGIRLPRLSFLDLLLVSFLLVSLASTAINIAQGVHLNLNHLYAQFAVIALYYFSVRTAIENSSFVDQPEALIKFLYGLFLLMVLTLAVDYILLIKGVNIANYLPMEMANKPAGAGVTSRPRGFFVEPTDLGLALNAIGPVVLAHLYISKSYRLFTFTLFLFLAAHIPVRSAAALAGLSAGVLFSLTAALLASRGRFAVPKPVLRNLGFLLLVVVGVFFAFREVITENVMVMITKIFFAHESVSASNRYNAWRFTFSLFLDAPNPLIGYGTGYMSANHDSSISWVLSVLVENGILGILLLVSMVIFALLKISRLGSKIKYGFYISVIAVSVHLVTNTGFYFPFLWLLLVLVQCDWAEEKARSSADERFPEMAGIHGAR